MMRGLLGLWVSRKSARNVMASNFSADGRSRASAVSALDSAGCIFAVMYSDAESASIRGSSTSCGKKNCAGAQCVDRGWRAGDQRGGRHASWGEDAGQAASRLHHRGSTGSSTFLQEAENHGTAGAARCLESHTYACPCGW
eukprot:363634-Chlamydomonas_euryale.AAC.21